MNIAQIDSLDVYGKIDLSWKAKGVYAWICGHPESSELSKGRLIEVLRGNGKDGVESIKTAIKELESARLIEWEYKKRCPTLGQNGKPGFIYLMLEVETRLYKIGSSKHPKKRARSVASDRNTTINLLQTIPCDDMGRAERAFHKKYEFYRRDGEFFELPDWAVSAILNQEVA